MSTLQPSADTIHSIAHEIGFDLVRFGPADPGDHRDRFTEWLDAGRHGEMDYLQNVSDAFGFDRATFRRIRASHLGPERDRGLIEGLDLRPVPLADAESVLYTDLIHDET